MSHATSGSCSQLKTAVERERDSVTLGAHGACANDARTRAAARQRSSPWAPAAAKDSAMTSRRRRASKICAEITLGSVGSQQWPRASVAAQAMTELQVAAAASGVVVAAGITM